MSVQLVFLGGIFSLVLNTVPAELMPLALLGILIVLFNWRFIKPPRRRYYGS
jgi:hypothetical protein